MRSDTRLRAALLKTVILGLLIVSCGGGSGDGAVTDSSAPPALAAAPAEAPALPPATTSAPTPPPTPTPGTVTLDISGVTDATGLILLGMIGQNSPRQAMSAVCGFIDTDPFSFTGEFLPITGDDPCTLGTVPVEFGPGSYEVVVAVFQGGSQTPEQCTQTEVTVNGDVTVEVTSLGSPAACDF